MNILKYSTTPPAALQIALAVPYSPSCRQLSAPELLLFFPGSCLLYTSHLQSYDIAEQYPENKHGKDGHTHSIIHIICCTQGIWQHKGSRPHKHGTAIMLSLIHIYIILEYGKPIYPKELPKEDRKFLGAYTQNIIQEMLDKNAELEMCIRDSSCSLPPSAALSCWQYKYHPPQYSLSYPGSLLNTPLS